MIRAFIAVVPPPVLQQSFWEVRTAFAEYGHAFRWVKPENVHLTLKFLGNISAETAEAIGKALHRVVAGQMPFTLCACGLGCFPRPSAPRVLWIGLDDPHRRLFTLQQHLDTELAALGFAPESRPFHPHLTLARVQKLPNRARFLSLLQTFRDHKFGLFPVQELHLFRSQLHPQGALYTILQTVTLSH